MGERRCACAAQGLPSYALLHANAAVSYMTTHTLCPSFPSLEQSLRQKAAFRNPDEFYFAMEKARTRDGVHIARRVRGLSPQHPSRLRCAAPLLSARGLSRASGRRR